MPVSEIDGSFIEQDIIDRFQMPPVLPGQLVKWWPDGIGLRQSAIASIVSSGKRSVQLRVGGGLMKAEVRHKNDPKLMVNVDQRADGCWDYTDDYYEAKRVIDDLQVRMRKIEDTVSKLTVVVAAKKIHESTDAEDGDSDEKSERKQTGFARRAALRSQALELGIPVPIKASSSDIEQLIAEHKSQSPDAQAVT